MGSEKKKLDQDYTPPKLSLPLTRQCMLPEAPTPPPRTTAVSVPFQWEEAPGKPRHCHRDVSVARALELPPRLVETKVSSPTTVLDGPYVGRATSFTSSYRNSVGTAKFGSTRWVDRAGSFDCSDGNITRVRRRGSFSQGTSHFWASIYESFKQVFPWKKRSAPKIDTV